MPATKTPVIEWIRKDAAAERLNVSPRSVLAMAAEGKIQRKQERDPGTNQLVMLLHAGDIERLAYEREHPAQPVQGETSTALQTLPAALQTLPAKLSNRSAKGVEQGLLSLLTSHAAQPERPWLTLPEAAEQSGLTERWLVQAAEKNTRGIRDMGRGSRGGRWRFHRSFLAREDAGGGELFNA
jgi:hypothetical protein